MRADSFFDTNLLVYLYSEDEKEKGLVVNKLIDETTATVSTQVLQELSNTLLRKFKVNEDSMAEVLGEVCSSFFVFTNDERTITDALRVRKPYGYSFYDSLIIASALQCRCKLLYSEDMQHGQMIDGLLRIVNPFKSDS